MGSSSVALSPPSLSSFPQALSHYTARHRNLIILQFQLNRTSLPSLQASRRFSNSPQEGDNLVDDPRIWSTNRSGIVIGDYDDDDDDDDEADDDDEDRSLDLLVRFVENVFKKISRKARKAVRSVLPGAVSTKLVVCTLGSVVYVSILLIRGIWTGISYVQESRNRVVNDLDENHAWTGTRPAN
ncbi:unnamed protein product [Ilex paraguariensis]|uniref:Uncharacterized protein n=1 Tax=Ilex paraguariensis TaxID=185542 RepID=A0ABC8RJT6_9AQUA